MKNVFRALFILHLFVGLGALGGGLMAMIFPEGPAGMPNDALQNSPFTNYFIPGLILFTVIGLGNIFSAVMIKLNPKFQGYISNIFSWALVIWIIVQCIMLNTIAVPHVLYFFIGLAEAALSVYVLFKQRLFPVNLLLDAYDRVKEKAK